MIIQSDSITMNSARRYSSRIMSSSSLKVWDNNTRTTATVADAANSELFENTTQTGLLDTAKKVLNEQEKEREKEASDNGGAEMSFNDLMERYKSTQNVKNVSLQERLDSLNKIRQQTLDYLLYLLFGKPIDTSKYSTYQDTSSLNYYGDSGSGYPQTESYGGSFFSWNYISETETTAFSTTGKVITGDGQQIDFNISLEMSRSFMEVSSSIIEFGDAQYKDPLVINLDCGAAEVTDQKFYFDIDVDGKEDCISMLGPGSGYLALDQNNDGIINDGSELFGTSNGNGFADLAQYDLDGNGWIDEADEIFEKLKIWSIDSEGNSTLVGIGKAGVGAIYLGSADTEFSLNNSMNVNNAVVRKTGMFLYENGGVGTIQQLDLAT